MSRPPAADDALNAAHTCYRLQGGALVPVLDSLGMCDPRAELIHEQFRALVFSRRFSCLGAKAALQGGNYWFGAYEPLASDAATTRLAKDLEAFSREDAARPSDDPVLRTFVAAFSGPVCEDERCFESLIWRQLQALHGHDESGDWDPAVSSDPDDPHFSFSFARRAYFVVGLHAASSRWARRFAWPTLVFNPHQQFDRLRESGHFTRFRDQIRARDRTLQQSLNPMLSDFGQHSEARQYSGRKVEHDWRCPFQADR